MTRLDDDIATVRNTMASAMHSLDAMHAIDRIVAAVKERGEVVETFWRVRNRNGWEIFRTKGQAQRWASDPNRCGKQHIHRVTVRRVKRKKLRTEERSERSCTECGVRTTNFVDTVVGVGPGDGDHRRYCGNCVAALFVERDAWRAAAMAERERCAEACREYDPGSLIGAEYQREIRRLPDPTVKEGT